MARSNNSFIKKLKEEKKRKKKEEKFKKKLERKNAPSSGDLDDMLAYVDEEGNITTEPPEEQTETVEKEKE